MRRPSSTRTSSLLEVAACLAGALTACLSGVTVDLGSNYQRHLPEAGSPPPLAPESGADAPLDAPDAEDGDPLDTTADSPDADETQAPAMICIPNPSFEPLLDGAAGTSPLLADPPLWQACDGNVPTSQTCKLPPFDGSSYLGLSIGLAPYLYNPASVDTALCAPLQAGTLYSLQLELALDAPDTDASPTGEPPALQVWGANAACDPHPDLLARFSGATNDCGWKSLCATLVPQRAYSHVILVPEATSSTGMVFSQTNLLVDNLRSGGSCPPR